MSGHNKTSLRFQRIRMVFDCAYMIRLCANSFGHVRIMGYLYATWLLRVYSGGYKAAGTHNSKVCLSNIIRYD